MLTQSPGGTAAGLPGTDSGLSVPVADEGAAWLLSGWGSAKLGLLWAGEGLHTPSH